MMVQNLPLWVRKFAVDFIESVIPAIVVLKVALPADSADAWVIAGAVAAACGGALLSAGRRNWAGFLIWLNDKLGTTSA